MPQHQDLESTNARELSPGKGSIVGAKTSSALLEEIKGLDKLLGQHQHEISQLRILRRMKQEAHDRLVSQDRSHELVPPLVKRGNKSEATSVTEDIWALMSAFNSGISSIEENVNRICGIKGRPLLSLPESSPTLDNKLENGSQIDTPRPTGPLPLPYTAPLSAPVVPEHHDLKRCEAKELRPERDSVVRAKTSSGSQSEETPMIEDIMAMMSAFNSSISSIGKNINRDTCNMSGIPLPAPESPSHTNTSMDLQTENKSQVESAYCSSPTTSQPNLVEGQTHAIDTPTSYRKEEETCHRCRSYEMMYECSSCMMQWYCRRMCQPCWLNSHRKHCGK